MRIRSLLFVLGCLMGTVLSAQTATTPTSGCAPFDVSFAAPAGGGPYFWVFGDGATSTQEKPTNQYTTPGTYTVLFSKTAGGTPIGAPITVTVSAKPVPIITTTSLLKGCTPLTVNLKGGTVDVVPGGITGFKWSYGDGSPADAGQTVTKTYTGAGTYTVTLEVQTTYPSCNVTKQFIDYIVASKPPIVSFTTTPNPPTACVPPLTVSFTNTSSSLTPPLSYVWKLPNNQTSNIAVPAPVVLTKDGTYPVKLIATDANNCKDSSSITITIGKPHSSFKVPDTVCINTPVLFTNTSTTGSYTWDFGAGATPSTSNAISPTVTFATAGVKNIKLSTTSGACTGDTTITIFVEDPLVTITCKPTYSCSEPVTMNFTSTSPSKITSWNWDFGDKTTGSTVANPSHTYFIHDSAYTKLGMHVFPVKLNVVTAAGCKGSFTVKDTIFLPWARFVPDLHQGCAPLTVTFSDSSTTNPLEPLSTWFWEYGDGTTNTFTNKGPHSHVFTNPGKYDVKLIITNSKGCKDTSYTVRIEVGTIKPIDFTVDKTSICPGDSITFTNTTPDKTGFTAWHFSTSGELLSHCGSNDNPKHAFNNKTGAMDITLTGDYNGCLCTLTKPALITVKGPIARMEYHTDCAKPYEVKFTDKSGDATKLLWNFGDGSPVLDTTGTFTHTYAATGDYKVVLTAINTCPDSKDTVTIHIRDPKAKFISDKLICQGSKYTFDASASIDVNPACYRGYSWVFSDPDKRPITVNTPVTSIDFFKHGNQNVSLVVEDINGCKDTATIGIKVYALQAAYSVSDASICLPAKVLFDPKNSTSDTTITNWDWNFGDGNTATIGLPLKGDTNYVYNSFPGTTATTTLIITDKLGCKSTITKDITIYKPSSAIIVTPKTDICKGTEITLSGTDYTAQGSNLKFDWDLGDNTIIANTKDIKHNYAASGSYTVTLTYTENGSACTGKLQQVINVQDYPVASFTSDPANSKVLCYPQVVDFSNNSTSTSPIVSYLWDLGNGLTSTNPTASNSYKKGVFKVKLTVTTSFGCSKDTTMTYNVVGPEGAVTVSPTTPICRGEAITFTVSNLIDVDTYTWKFGDGTSVSNKSPVSHVYAYVPPSGKTAAALILYDVNKVCAFTIPIDVYMQAVKTDFISVSKNVIDTTICIGDSIVFTNKSTKGNGITYLWNLGDGATSTSDATISHFYQAPGIYNVTLITASASLGCKDTLVKPIVVNKLPVVKAVGDSICPGENAQLFITPHDLTHIYSWKPKFPKVSDSTIYNPVVIKVDTSTYFTVTVTDTNKCTTVDSAFVFAVPDIVDPGLDTTIVIGDEVILPIDNRNGSIFFTWTPTAGLSCLQCSNPVVRPFEDIIYYVIMEDKFKCSTGNGKFIIRIRPETKVEVPTTFTPNGDGSNDVIYVKGWGIKDLIYFQIYNRWGELVFESSELSEGWDGTYKSTLQNNDIYVYKVKVVDYRNKELFKEGHINLMR